jgi:hypothetical protein
LAGPLTVEGNAVSPGQGGPTAGDWQTFGSGSFLQGNGTLGFAPGAGQTHTVSDVIADQSGNDRSVADGTDGSWSLLKKGGWALVLGNSGTALPGVAVAGGTLSIAADGALGSGMLALGDRTTVALTAGGNYSHALSVAASGGLILGNACNERQARAAQPERVFWRRGRCPSGRAAG